MELGLEVLVPATGARADVLVRAADGSCLGDVEQALLARVLPAGRTGVLRCDDVLLPPSTLLGVPPLVHGALLVVDGPSPAPQLRGLPELRVVGGPASGSVHLLHPGAVVLGRGRSAGVPLGDPEVSAEHCRLRLTAEGATVTDLGSTNGSTVDGVPVEVHGSPLLYGAVLRVGASSLVLCPASGPPAPLAPAPDGRRAFDRPPRLRPPVPLVQVLVPGRPPESQRTPVPVVAVLAPLLLGLAMWRLTGSTTFLLLTLLSPLLVVGGVVTDRRAGTRRSRRELRHWRAERAVAERVLERAVRDDEAARRADAPDPAEVLLTALGPLPRLWERRCGDDDLLELRLGLADQPARVEAEGDLPPGATTARSVPVVVPLRTAGVLGIAGPRTAALGLARWVVAQTAVRQGPRDVSVVVLAEPAAAGCWAWAGRLPHTRPDRSQDCRALLGLDPAQAAARVRELTALVEERRAGRGAAAPGLRSPERPVLLVVDGTRGLRSVPGLPALLTDGPSAGVHAVCLAEDAGLLPEQCGATAVLTGSAGLTVSVAGRPQLHGAVADLVAPAWTEALARALAPLQDRDQDSSSAGVLPPSVRWSELVQLSLDGSAQDADRVLERWACSGRSPSAALGRGPDGVLAVDLARDGPHALVAGTTGAGKSELLQTLIASLALGSRPDELTLVLVDYKGGAAFGPCEQLPHVVGLVTDLDGALVERALASLAAELSRRERVLQAAGVSDVDALRRRAGDARLPRLVIVVDEFASLAEELPDFVGGLVGIAMRGRSLGVHLVLATQRPEGVVSADIRANTNLRICLAVTRDSESRDVIDSPVAATVRRDTPGRGWVRTGHADLTPFQTGRVGGPLPRAAAAQPPTVELLPTAELGAPRARPAVQDPLPAGGAAEPEVTDLSLLVDACAAAAARLGLPAQASPWLAPLPATVVLAELPRGTVPPTDGPGRLPAVAYGLLDVPAEQQRRPLVLDLDACGSLLVVGAPRSGRTTALRTLAGALAAECSPEDVHLYVLEPSGGALGALLDLPHTGAVVAGEQPERLDRLLTWLADEVGRRQACLADGGHADLPEQRAAAARPDRLPHLVLLLDRWEAFVATHGELDGGRLVDLLHRLLREGPSVGLHVVVSADRSGLVGRLSSLVADRLLLRLADRGDYPAAGVPGRLVPADLPAGRGWSLGAAPLAAQVALLADDPSGPAQAAALAALAARHPAPVLHRPHRVEPLPVRVRRWELPPASAPGRVVLGVGGDELQPVELDLSGRLPGLLVGGPAGSGRSTTLLTLGADLTRGGRPVLAVAPRASPLRRLPGCLSSTDAVEELDAALARGGCALLLDDAELLVDSPLAPLLEQAVLRARDTGTVVVAAGGTEELVAGYRGFVVQLRRGRTGLLLSPRSPGDGDLLGVRLSRAHSGTVRPGRALLVQDGRVQRLQVATPD